MKSLVYGISAADPVSLGGKRGLYRGDRRVCERVTSTACDFHRAGRYFTDG